MNVASGGEPGTSGVSEPGVSGSVVHSPPRRWSSRPDPDIQPVNMHYFGGSGEPLIIAHAAGFCADAYAPVANELQNRFEVWGMDLRGHGDSPVPAGGDFSWDGMARDVLTVVRALGRGPAAFFGHSLGGGAGLRAEALVPGTFSSMYVYEPAVLPDIDGIDVASRDMAKLVRRRRSVFGSRAEAALRLSARPPFDTMCADALVAFTQYGLREIDGRAYELKCSPENEAMVYESLDKITVAQIADVSVPVMLAIGERENGLPALAAPMIMSALSDARLVGYPNLGHLGPFERPRQVAADAADHVTRRRSR